MNHNPALQIFSASKKVLSNWKYLVAFFLLSLVMSALFIYIPVKTIPGNSLSFQSSIFTSTDYLFMSLLAILTGLLLAMNVYIFRQKMLSNSVSSAGVGGSAGIVAAIFATASCTSCIAAIFGFLGAPFVFYLTGIRNYIVVVSLSLILVSLYFAAKSVNKVCELCKVPEERKNENK